MTLLNITAQLERPSSHFVARHSELKCVLMVLKHFQQFILQIALSLCHRPSCVHQLASFDVFLHLHQQVARAGLLVQTRCLEAARLPTAVVNVLKIRLC